MVHCPVFGTFLPADAFYQSAQNQSDETEQVVTKDKLAKLESTTACFAPSVQLIENLKLSFNEDGICNLNPYLSYVSTYTHLIL